jgi:CBS domain-containing protein/ribosome-associated translation inhibitor RaiA
MRVGEVMTKNIYTLSKNDTVAKAISLMIEKRFHQIPIVEKKYEGMVFLKDLIKCRSDPTKTKLENFITTTPILKEGMDILEATKVLIGSGLRALPVVEGKNIVGILSETDVILRIKRKELRNVKASEVMSKVIVASENERLRTILRIMEKNRISSVPLVDWKEELSGCINLFSIARFLCKKKERIESLRSAKERENILDNPAKNFSFMPNTAAEDTTLEEIVKLLQNGEEVVITEKNRPRGIIKARDVLERLSFKERVPVLISGIEEGREKIVEFLERTSEKWKKLDVQQVVIQVEKVGAREKYFGRIKAYMRGEILIASSQAFDLNSLVRELREKIEREIIKRREIRRDKKKMIKIMGE